MIILKVLFLLLSIGKAIASPDDIDRLDKCYKQFAGEIISPTHPILIKVKQGNMSGATACSELLKSAHLVSGVLNSTTKEEGKKILHTFNILHNSFFSNLSVLTDINRSEERWLNDYNQRSYYLLLAMFSRGNDGSSNYPFRSIFTDPTTYKSVRESASPNGFRVGRIEAYGREIHHGVLPFPICHPNGAWNQWGPQCQDFPFTYSKIDPRILVDAKIDVSSGVMVQNGTSSRIRESGKLLDIGGYQFMGQEDHQALLTNHSWTWSLDETVLPGDLIGVIPGNSKSLPHVHQNRFNSSDGYARHYLGPAYKQPYPSPIENIYDNLGTGILFPPSGQSLLGLDDEQIAVQNGVDKIPRIWVQNTIKDFFCRDIPVIRLQDAAAHTSPIKVAKAAFRESASCMRCHATLDSLSFISRNYQLSTTSVFGNGIMVNQFHTPTKEPLNELPTVPDDFFAVRPADGDFIYRDFKGNYHQVHLTSSPQDPKKSFREFGEYIANMDDPYVCLTSKYFTYLTGIQPLFFDPGDADAPVLSERDKAIQAYMFTLGNDLKQTGDLKKVILEIVSSNLFLDPEAKLIK